ncbi:type VI secretion protein [Streptomyces sp. WAC 06738]|uniref:type VI secretion protein n=1 Tax=Streptomyces sp. WAC 06738 TaxID=2203210 RepID=UPI000F6B8D6E|nr:type VI secretion protein [Streptomyces sp. WAC 06738]AZM47583.1 type VI secretion protein [Streptomyces sp. WAC 06738]
MAQGRGGRNRGGGQQGGPERGIPDALLLGVLAFLLGLTILAWTATGLSGLLAHGAWPDGVTFTRTPLAMRELVSEPHDLPAAWPDTPRESLSGWGLFWGVFISQLMVLGTFTLAGMTTMASWRARRAAARKAAAGDEALAGGLEHRYEDQDRYEDTESAAQPMPRRRPPVRPAHDPHPQPTQPLPTVPRQRPAQPSAGLPPAHAGPLVFRKGSPTAMAVTRETLLGAEGPALVITSDATLWADTKDARGKLGPVLLYDPGQLCDTPDRLRWSPAAGCADRETASERAAALLRPVRPQHRTDTTVADTAETMLACWLHAAAVGDRPFAQVHRWAQGTGAHEPVGILRSVPEAASGAAGELESALTGHPERRDAAAELVATALEGMSSIHMRNASKPTRADSLVLESFIDEGGTLYLVGEAIEGPRSRPGAMPLLTALATDVVEHGRRMAAGSSTGRLDPPLTLVLDDVAAVAPLAGLPALLTEGDREGLPTLATMRSPEQARSRWPGLSLGV